MLYVGFWANVVMVSVIMFVIWLFLNYALLVFARKVSQTYASLGCNSAEIGTAVFLGCLL